LSPAVPDEVGHLFEVARAIFVYGYCFYPLYAHGIEQLPRVAEAAVKHRCRMVGAPVQVQQGKRTRLTTFAENLRSLVDRGELDTAQQTEWEGMRQARNFASHLDDVTIIPPTLAPQALARTARLINALFAPPVATAP